MPSRSREVIEEPQLLATKLFVPQSRQALIERARLDPLLEQPATLTLLSAPAGFGKSTAVSHWLERRALSPAWLSLEPADDEPRRFLRYLLSAWRRQIPGIGVALEAGLRSPGPLPETELTVFLNELNASRQECLLVLDDYHVIGDSTIHAVVERMLDGLPPTARVVMTTRIDPPFPLPRMRARGTLTEIRAGDLRFSAAETGAFLAQALGSRLADPEVEALRRRTDGWAAGLQLAALSLRGRTDPAAFVSDFTGSHRFVLDYLTDEVLARLPPDTLRFLLRIALLDEVCGALAEVMTGEPAGQARLEELEELNLFLLPLDDRRHWYRFHHLFAECLRRVGEVELDDGERRELRRRAARWLNRADRPDAALDHALVAGDRELAVAVLRRHTEPAIARGEIDRLGAWFDRVPAEWVGGDPGMLADRGLVLFLTLRWSDLETIAPSLLEALASAHQEQGEGRLTVTELLLARAQADDDRVLTLARRALDQLPATDSFRRGVAAVLLQETFQDAESADAAREAFELSLSLNRANGNRLAVASTYFHRGRLAMFLGDTRGALDLHRRGVEELSWGDSSTAVATLPMAGEAETLFLRGAFEEAERRAEQAIAVNSGASPFPDLIAWIVRVDAARMRRDFSEARSRLARFEELVSAARLEPWLRHSAYQWALAQAKEFEVTGRAEARKDWERWLVEEGWVDANGRRFEGDPTERFLADWPWDGSATLWARWLIHQGDVEPALEVLAWVREQVEARGWIGSIVRCRLLEAKAQASDQAAAIAALEDALRRAERAELIAPLADEREWLMPLCAATGIVDRLELRDSYRARLLEALDLPGQAPPQSELVEALSEREIEVLTSVAEGRTNAQAGRHLFISPSTVKKHLENIYGKLAVGGRVAAIARARELGLLE